MKTELRLESVVADGVAGPQSSAISAIYSFLIYKYGQNVYRFILINQIDNSLEEVIIKEGTHIYINIIYETECFSQKSKEEKYLIWVDIINTALLRIAEKDKKIEPSVLETIRREVITGAFTLPIPIKTLLCPKNENLKASIILLPEIEVFRFFVQVEESNRMLCRILFYNGQPITYYIQGLFGKAKWKSDSKFIITGKESNVMIELSIENCSVTYTTPVGADRCAFFQMFRTDIPDEQIEKAKDEVVGKILPGFNPLFRQSDN